MKSRLPFALALAGVAVAMFTLVAASPTPGASPSATAGASATPRRTASATPSRTATPAPDKSSTTLGFSFSVERGSVLHLTSTRDCPEVPSAVLGSHTVSVMARVLAGQDPAGPSLVSATAAAADDGSWEVNLPVPAGAALGAAPLGVSCLTGTPAGSYYRYSWSSVSIVEAVNAPAKPSEGPSRWLVLAVSLLAGLALGIAGMWTAGRLMSSRRMTRATAVSSGSAPEETTETAPEAGVNGGIAPEDGGSDETNLPVG